MFKRVPSLNKKPLSRNLGHFFFFFLTQCKFSERGHLDGNEQFLWREQPKEKKKSKRPASAVAIQTHLLQPGCFQHVNQNMGQFIPASEKYQFLFSCIIMFYKSTMGSNSSFVLNIWRHRKAYLYAHEACKHFSDGFQESNSTLQYGLKGIIYRQPLRHKLLNPYHYIISNSFSF